MSYIITSKQPWRKVPNFYTPNTNNPFYKKATYIAVAGLNKSLNGNKLITYVNGRLGSNTNGAAFYATGSNGFSSVSDFNFSGAPPFTLIALCTVPPIGAQSAVVSIYKNSTTETKTWLGGGDVILAVVAVYV